MGLVKANPCKYASVLVFFRGLVGGVGGSLVWLCVCDCAHAHVRPCGTPCVGCRSEQHERWIQTEINDNQEYNV